jgi:hypothetical protein
MNLLHRTVASNDHLLSEIARTNLTLDGVYLLYGVLALTVALSWLVGVAVFGRSSPSTHVEPAGRSDRATPVVP